MVPLSFAGQNFVIVDRAALYWPGEGALFGADLHFEKASWFAARGQMLPPYDSRDTLERVALAIRETGARRVYTLGDNFHDSRGVERLEPHAAGMLAAWRRLVPEASPGDAKDGPRLAAAPDARARSMQWQSKSAPRQVRRRASR